MRHYSRRRLPTRFGILAFDDIIQTQADGDYDLHSAATLAREEAHRQAMKMAQEFILPPIDEFEKAIKEMRNGR